MIISRTPFRISFFGGGTDYPAWYLKHGGKVLSTTINKYTYVTCRWLPPFFPHKYRIAYSKIEDVVTPGEIAHPAVRAVFSHYESDRGIELHSDADLPSRAGLGSSSSFIVGLLNSMEALHCRRASPGWLAREGIRYEQVVLNEHVGSQDQTAAAYGGLNAIHFGQDGEIDVQPVILGKARKKELCSHMMLFFSGFSRSASNIAEAQLKNMPNCQNDLKAMGNMVDQAIDILTEGADIRQFGELLHDAWTRKRRLSGKIATESIDLLYEKARKAGAIGGKLLGAGGGGFFLLFVEPSRQEDVKTALGNLLHVPFEMENSGSQIIYFTE